MVHPKLKKNCHPFLVKQRYSLKVVTCTAIIMKLQLFAQAQIQPKSSHAVFCTCTTTTVIIIPSIQVCIYRSMLPNSHIISLSLFSSCWLRYIPIHSCSDDIIFLLFHCCGIVAGIVAQKLVPKAQFAPKSKLEKSPSSNRL
jgi:hypothetical protein